MRARLAYWSLYSILFTVKQEFDYGHCKILWVMSMRKIVAFEAGMPASLPSPFHQYRIRPAASD